MKAAEVEKLVEQYGYDDAEDLARHLTLAAHLDCSPDDISPTGYNNSFEINPRKEKRGPSPEEVKQVIADLRLCFSQFPPDTFTIPPENWATDHVFYKAHFEANAIKATIERIKKDLKPIAVKLESREQLALENYGKLELAKLEKDSTARRKALLKPCYSDKWQFKELYEKFDFYNNQIIEQETQLAAVPCYQSISAQLYKLFEDKPELKKLNDTHRIINALYYLADPDACRYGRQNIYKTMLLQAFNGEAVEDLRESYNTNSGEYMVLTDEEADEAAREDCLNYIDECMELDETARKYFDEEKFINDCMTIDGRGHILNRYNGQEGKVKSPVNNETYYIYQTN